MKPFRNIKQKKHALLLIYFPFHFLWYEILRIINADNPNVLTVSSPIDEHIPFCEWFVFPYVLWYVYIAAMLLYTLSKNRRDFLRTDILLAASMFFPMLFCTLVPNAIPLEMRPDFETLGRENIATKLVQLLYAADSPPLNVFPSVHVSVSCALFFAAIKAKVFNGKYIIKTLAGLFSLSVIASTVLIKQHSILDVFAGVFIAVFIFAATLIAEKIYDSRKISED